MAASHLGLVVDESTDTPIYQQVFDAVAERIRSGAFPSGFRLPATRDLAQGLGIHRNTIVRAYGELEAAGFIRSTVGRGSFVADDLSVACSPVTPNTERRMAWTGLLSRAGRSTPWPPVIPPSRSKGSAINFARMQPAPELLPSDLLRRCAEHVQRSLGPKCLEYAPHDGVQRLREQVTIDLGRRNVPARPEDILITSGSQQGIDLLGRALVDPGETVLVQSPTYGGAIRLFSALGAHIVSVPSDGEGPDLDALARLGKPGVALLYLMPNHCNPTGAVISPDRRQAIIRWASDAQVPVIEDDYAADLELDGGRPPVAMRALDAEVLYISTFSKKLAPALRVGFIVCPQSLRPALVSLKHTFDLGSSLLLEETLAEFLERGYLTAHLKHIQPEYRKRRDLVAKALRAHAPAEARWALPRRGVSFWMDLPSESVADAVANEARERGVLVTPSRLNRVDEAGPHGVRLNFCSESHERLVTGTTKLCAALKVVLQGNLTNGPTESVLGTV